MLKNYLKIAWRTLGRNKSNALINVLGLAIGMACAVLILLFVQDELSYDAFHQKRDRIFRIAGEYDQGGTSRNRSAMTTYRMKPWLDASFPDIKNVVRLDPRSTGVVKLDDQLFQESNVLYADEKFFELFTYTWLQGDPATALAEPNTLVLSHSAAQKYFDSANPLGEILQVNGVPVKITGVIADMPASSHFHGDFILSMKTAEPAYPNWILTNATGTSHYTYVELNDGIAPETIERQLAEFMRTKDERFAAERRYFLQPLADIHLHSHLNSEIEANGDILYVYLLSVVAVIILMMACINYMNLAVARAANRSTEVGLRKVVGASRRQLATQFLGESVITALAALFFAVILVELSMPYFNALAGKSLHFEVLQNVPLFAGLTFFAIAIGLLSGSYPAAFLSAMHSISTLKGQLTRSGSMGLRKGLVLVQFVASVALLAGTLLIYDQINFMQNKKLGIDAEHVLTVPLANNEIADKFEQLRTVLQENPNILHVAATNNPLPARVSNWREYDLEGREEDVMIPTMVVTHDFFATLKTDFIAGRDFERTFGTDDREAYILNESAAKFLELEAPLGTALNGRIYDGTTWGRKQAKIIGVVRDFHMASLHTEIQPTVFSLHTQQTTPLRTMAIKVNADQLASTLSFIEKNWHEMIPQQPFSFNFLNESVDKLYHAERRFLQVFLTFTLLAIAVTCLGVLGLSAYTAQQRRREIGIRKVLGATVPNILLVLSSGFVKLVLIANLLAWPIAWYAMHKWLENFAYRVDIGWWVFALAGGLALLIALLTVSTQAIRAALANPVDSLRYE